MESVTLHYLKAWNRLINSCFLAQIPSETRLSIHDSPFFLTRPQSSSRTGAKGAGGDGKGKARKTTSLSLAFVLPITPLAPLRRDRERRLGTSQPFFAHEQDTVGTFPAPPDPTGKVPAFSITYVTKPEVVHKFVAVKRQFSFVRFYSFFIIAV